MNELNKRMFAIESLLSRLEEKMTPADEVRLDELVDLISSSFKQLEVRCLFFLQLSWVLMS